MRALVADDDRVTARVLQRTLERLGLDVVTVHDGAGAWDLLQRDPTIALCVLDWMMPEADGPDLCRRIRRDQSRAHVYVMLLTARQSREDLIAGLDAGADDYIVKPFDPEELRARVQVGLRVLGLQARLAEQVAELKAALSQVKQLRGLLPICAYCKSIRSDENYWQEVDHYVSEHSGVQFSHGICPKCLEKVMKDYE